MMDSAVPRLTPWTEDEMSKGASITVGGVAVGIVLLVLGLPLWAVLLIIVGVPVAGYLMLDKSQRSRLRGVSRKRLGR
jgi:hypothetical protein